MLYQCSHLIENPLLGMVSYSEHVQQSSFGSIIDSQYVYLDQISVESVGIYEHYLWKKNRECEYFKLC